MHTAQSQERSRHRTLRTALVLSALVLSAPVLTGCTSFRPAPAGEVAPDTDVRLTFEPPRSLVFVSSGGDSVTFAGVEELRGKVVAQSADSLTVEASWARIGGSHRPRSQRFGSGALVRVPSERVDVGRTSLLRTILLVGLMAGVVTLVVAIAGEFDSEPTNTEKSAK